MKNNKRNIFGIIKETVIGSTIDFFKSLASVEPDEMQDELDSPQLRAQVAGIEGTTFTSSDFVEVEAGKTVKFGSSLPERRMKDTNRVINKHKENKEMGRDIDAR